MIIGIDLGTTNSLVGVWRNGEPELIPNALGSLLTPSAISIDDSGTVLLGSAARERLSTAPDRSVASFKRYMGTNRIFKLGKKAFRAEELSALVLRSLKADAERFLGETVTEAVITVPAYFSDGQRKATKAAGELAGLKVERLLNEPTAAALAYGLQEPDTERKIMVLDLGGGTFDVSILEMFDGVMEVRATAGDNFLGGEDFVDLIMDGFIGATAAEAKIPPRTHDAAIHGTLRRQAEIAKRALSDSHEHQLALIHQGKELRWTIGRDRFEAMSEPLVRRLRMPIERALRDSELQPAQITHLVLAGGATRMPLFRKLVARLFQRLPIVQVNPDEVVAQGAAVQAGLKMRDAALDDVVMTDVAPFTMGVEICETRGGMVARTGLYLPIIERNSVIPISRAQTICTAVDNQTDMKVRVYQGESRMVAENIPLGQIELRVPKGPAGQEFLDIRFTYDTSGLLEVVARVNSTEETQRLVIEGAAGSLSREEVEAKLRALDGLKTHPREQAENQAVLARAERLYEERLGAERSEIARLIDQFRFVLDSQDVGAIAALRTKFTTWLDGVDRSFFP
jgi:molecular chaperone HscC